METDVEFKTKSEELFSRYLDVGGYEWEYESPIPGQVKRPDFRIRHGTIDVLCDVKERSPTNLSPGPRSFDPISKVLKLIEKGREKFQSFHDHLCILVVYNNGDQDTRLDPMSIYGAMLGYPGIRFSFNPKSGTVDRKSGANVFLPFGGKMIRRYSPLELHESPRILSAIIALKTYRIPNPDYELAYRNELARQIKRIGRTLTDEERCAIHYKLIVLDKIRATLGETSAVTVCTNPFAVSPLPEDMFKGAYDERWAIIDDTLTRVFLGECRRSLEDDA